IPLCPTQLQRFQGRIEPRFGFGTSLALLLPDLLCESCLLRRRSISQLSLEGFDESFDALHRLPGFRYGSLFPDTRFLRHLLRGQLTYYGIALRTPFRKCQREIRRSRGQGIVEREEFIGYHIIEIERPNQNLDLFKAG